MAVGDGTPGPGRPKGLQNKFTRTVKVAFEEAFKDLQEDESDPAHLKRWARANPTQFYQIASKLIPAELNANVTGNLAGILGRIESKADDNPVA
jgi:hypothetical protein